MVARRNFSGGPQEHNCKTVKTVDFMCISMFRQVSPGSASCINLFTYQNFENPGLLLLLKENNIPIEAQTLVLLLLFEMHQYAFIEFYWQERIRKQLTFTLIGQSNSREHSRMVHNLKSHLQPKLRFISKESIPNNSANLPRLRQSSPLPVFAQTSTE